MDGMDGMDDMDMRHGCVWAESCAPSTMSIVSTKSIMPGSRYRLCAMAPVVTRDPPRRAPKGPARGLDAASPAPVW